MYPNWQGAITVHCRRTLDETAARDAVSMFVIGSSNLMEIAKNVLIPRLLFPRRSAGPPGRF
jgi:hypothetical protein